MTRDLTGERNSLIKFHMPGNQLTDKSFDFWVGTGETLLRSLEKANA